MYLTSTTSSRTPCITDAFLREIKQVMISSQMANSSKGMETAIIMDRSNPFNKIITIVKTYHFKTAFK